MMNEEEYVHKVQKRLQEHDHTRTMLTGEMIWEAFRPMFQPHSTAPWSSAAKDTQEKYNKAAEKLNRQLGIIR